MRHSPHTITYRDWVILGEHPLKEAEAHLAGARGRGVTNLEALSHDVETARSLLRALRRCEPGKQTDLFALYEQVK